MEDEYAVNRFENEKREEFHNMVKCFVIDIANQMFIRKGRNPVNNPYKQVNPREDEINFAVEALAEILHETLKSETNEKTIEEHLIIHLIQEILTNTDGWKFNPKMNEHPDGTPDLMLFTATNENAMQATADIVTLVFASRFDVERNNIIEKYKAQYVQPGSWVLWFDDEHKQLVKFDFNAMTQKVVAQM